MSLLRTLAYSRPVLVACRAFFGLFYDRRCLRGYYFDAKRLGWYWAWRSLPSRLWGDHRRIPWPVHPHTQVAHPAVTFDVDDLHVFQVPGCYWQNHGAPIVLGRNVHIAPNVGIITTNHDVADLRRHDPGREVRIGNDCWIGMNAVILPGVVLGDRTVVGAGAVVATGFPDGHCVLGGVPAKILRKL